MAEPVILSAYRLLTGLDISWARLVLLKPFLRDVLVEFRRSPYLWVGLWGDTSV